jgi:pantoate--beta-alanine ligase
MYRPDASTFVEETSLSSGLCGKFRPGHFRGVTTVVAKLFNIVRPDVAVFGEKDAQQAAVIRRMAKDLDYPVEVVTAPTVREPDGLAMSSRNIRLSPAERGAAGALSRALSAAAAAFAAGERSSSSLRAGILSRLKSNSLLVPEYVEIVDGETLRETESVKPGTLIALAVHCGGTRLIDNIVLGRDPAGTGSI